MVISFFFFLTLAEANEAIYRRDTEYSFLQRLYVVECNMSLLIG